jgi:hypothetical protein
MLLICIAIQQFLLHRCILFVVQNNIREVVVLYIKAVFKAGHVGFGKHHEMVRYLEVTELTEALALAKTMPRVKKNRRGLGLISCCEITCEQYFAGKALEACDPYLNRELALA